MLEHDNKTDDVTSSSSKNGKVTKKKASRGTAVARKKRTTKNTSKKKATYKIVSRAPSASGTTKKTTRKPRSAPAETQSVSVLPTPVSRPASFSAPGHEPARPRMVSAEERQQLIAKAAYHLALQRGFHTSDPRQNWIDAEAEVDSKLAEPGEVSEEKGRPFDR